MIKLIRVIKESLFVVAVIIVGIAVSCIVFHIRPAVVLSGSMEPEIETGSLLFVNTNEKSAKTGDIIAFQAGAAQVSHRVVEVTSDGYVTKGDANETRDLSTVTEDRVIGVVFLWIPKLGYALKWLSSVSGMILAVTVCISLLLMEKLIGREEKANE